MQSQEIQKLKIKYIGMGVRRLRYEQRLAYLVELDPVDIGDRMGLNRDESIMVAEIIDIKISQEVSEFLELFRINAFSIN
jgi:hypothetical protein